MFAWHALDEIKVLQDQLDAGLGLPTLKELQLAFQTA